jgi:hypothetical protein
MNVGDEYRWRRAVEVTLEDADHELARRVLDFASGLVHVDGGAVTRMGEHRYRLTPGPGSDGGTAEDGEPRTPYPVAGAGSASVPKPDEEPLIVDAVGSPGLVHAEG